MWSHGILVLEFLKNTLAEELEHHSFAILIASVPTSCLRAPRRLTLCPEHF
jgi:hypothetical protein